MKHEHAKAGASLAGVSSPICASRSAHVDGLTPAATGVTILGTILESELKYGLFHGDEPSGKEVLMHIHGDEPIGKEVLMHLGDRVV